MVIFSERVQIQCENWGRYWYGRKASDKSATISNKNDPDNYYNFDKKHTINLKFVVVFLVYKEDRKVERNENDKNNLPTKYHTTPLRFFNVKD